MGNVQRVGYVAEELAYFRSEIPPDMATGANGNYEREKDDHANRFI